jgi:hypothetical protein
MAKYTPQMKTSDTSCNSSLMLVAFRLGYLQATCNQILAKVAAMQAQPTAPPPPPGPSILKHIKTVLDLLGVAYKALPVIRWVMAINFFGWLAKQGARLLGWL